MPKKRIKKAQVKNNQKAEKQWHSSARGTTTQLEKYKWPKGVSGNPNGRPPLVITLSNLIRTQSNELAYDLDGKLVLDHEGKPMSKINAMLNSAWEDAIFRHDNQARELLMNRGWGKVPLPFINIQEKINEFCEERGTNIGQLLPGDPGLSALLAAARIRGLVHGLPEGIEENGTANGNGTGANRIHRDNPPSETLPLPDKE